MVRMNSVTGALMATAMLVMPTAGSAQDRERAGEQPEVVREVLACRTIADNAARLACFDAQAARFETAVVSGEVVAADREQVRETNRSLFGLNLPRIRIFGSDNEQIEEITGEISGLSQTQDGKTLVILTDGARWAQTDNRPVIGVRVGQQVTIRRATLGSFFMRFANGGSVRARRLN